VGIASGIFMAAKSGVAWWKATVILTAGYIFSIIGRIAGIISDPYSIYLAGNTGFFKILISHDIG
jgi:hypothetical protein